MILTEALWYFMKTKSNTGQQLVNLLKLVKTQFHTKVQILYTDKEMKFEMPVHYA